MAENKVKREALRTFLNSLISNNLKSIGELGNGIKFNVDPVTSDNSVGTLQDEELGLTIELTTPLGTISFTVAVDLSLDIVTDLLNLLVNLVVGVVCVLLPDLDICTP